MAPRGTEERWLEASSVQRGLVKALCTANDLELKWCCAAWLRRSSLTRMVQLELFPPRRVAAWEALAQIACDPLQDHAARIAAQSVLLRDDLIIALWQLNGGYRVLVYELLLATGKRLRRIYASHQWELVE